MATPQEIIADIKRAMIELKKNAPPVVHYSPDLIPLDPPKFTPEFKMPYYGDWGVILADPRRFATIVNTDTALLTIPKSLRGTHREFGYAVYAREKRVRREAR